MTDYTKHFNTVATSQKQPIFGKETSMAKNNAGGYSFTVDKWVRLRRFLILGSEKGTYYATEQALTIESAKNVIECIKEDGLKVVNEVVEISQAGRAAKNDPALFVLALCSSPNFADEKTRSFALENLSKVARTGTHVFSFVRNAKSVRGFGRSLRKGLASVYLNKNCESLARLVTKYKQREGMSQRDVLRLCHPKSADPVRNAILKYVVSGSMPEIEDAEAKNSVAIRYLQAVEELKNANEKRIVELVREFELPEEVIPTDKRTPKVLEALIDVAGLTWLIRNLGNLTKDGVLVEGKFDIINKVVERITNQEALVKAKVHPVNILNALVVYKSGKNRHSTWTPVSKVLDALDKAFYLAFKNVSPTGKRFCLGLDVSGSMSGTNVVGIDNLTAREACGAMALVTKAVEENVLTVAFDTNLYNMDISSKHRLDDVVKTLARTGGGGTDCALPILFCTMNNIPIDVFVIYTDSQSWYGSMHPLQAIQQYRKKTGIPAKLVTVAMATNRFSIGDSEDSGMMELVGFDTMTPKLLELFANNEI